MQIRDMKGIDFFQNNVLGLLIALLFIYGCKKGVNNTYRDNNPIDYNRTVSEDDFYDLNNFKDTRKKFKFLNQEFVGFKKTVLLDELFFTAAVLPKEYFIKKQLKKRDSLSFYVDRLKTEEVVQFDIQSTDHKDVFEKLKRDLSYKEWVEYMSFGLRNDVFAITKEGDTIKASGSFFERVYKVTPYKRVLFYFSFPNEVNEFRLVYRDRIYGNGFIKFSLKKTF